MISDGWQGQPLLVTISQLRKIEKKNGKMKEKKLKNYQKLQKIFTSAPVIIRLCYVGRLIST